MQIHPSDIVEVRDDGQKYALRDIKKGENIIKYGFPIGSATADIKAGEKVSPKNLKSNLSGMDDWEYLPAETAKVSGKTATFKGYLRKNGEAGIRNELWIIPTVGCINDVAKALAAKSGGKYRAVYIGAKQFNASLKLTY